MTTLYVVVLRQKTTDDSMPSRVGSEMCRRDGDISGAAVRLGGLGGGREGVLQSEYQSTSDKKRAALQAGLLQQGFQQAQQARQQDLANQRGIATLQST